MSDETGAIDPKGEGQPNATDPPSADPAPSPEPAAPAATEPQPPADPAQSPEPKEPPDEGEPTEFKLPEGMSRDDPFVAAFQDFVKYQKLGQEGMDAMVKLYGGLVEKANAQAEAQEKAFRESSEKTLREAWGGDFDVNLKAANRGIQKVLGDEAEAFSKMLNDTGLGDHPALVKLFFNLDQMLGEDRFEPGKPRPGSGGPPRTRGGTPLLSYPTMQDQ